MECPKCKTEIPEGKLYCPECGYAVQIVPDYDASLEENLDSVGSDIAGNVNRIDVAESTAADVDINSGTRQMPRVTKEDAKRITMSEQQREEFITRLVTLGIAAILTVALIILALTLPKRLGDNSFIPQNAVDKAVSDGGKMNSMTLGPMDAAINVAMEETDGSLSEDEADEEASAVVVIEGELVVTPEPGSYSKAEYITANVVYEGGDASDDTEYDRMIYYTDDGSEPDTGSRVYKNKIPMPVGHSVYSFRYMKDNGELSDTVTCEYDLEHTGSCSAVDASNVIIATLIKDGVLLDIYGHSLNSIGTYTYRCDSMVRSGDGFYYIVTESYEEPGADKHDTGILYAVDADTMATFKAGIGADGGYTFVAIF